MSRLGTIKKYATARNIRTGIDAAFETAGFIRNLQSREDDLGRLARRIPKSKVDTIYNVLGATKVADKALQQSRSSGLFNRPGVSDNQTHRMNELPSERNRRIRPIPTLNPIRKSFSQRTPLRARSISNDVYSPGEFVRDRQDAETIAAAIK